MKAGQWPATHSLEQKKRAGFLRRALKISSRSVQIAGRSRLAHFLRFRIPRGLGWSASRTITAAICFARATRITPPAAASATISTTSATISTAPRATIAVATTELTAFATVSAAAI